ncbi:S9 family peptidase [Nonomuraea sp. WAC 01424]|uniref:alpha/beta hydrolase family protein n=1 Tax=Nonomuraea sp. WAC 01424 TaxID=2203200 RepID=UPI000F7826F1|nr:alpha/beta hydrolase [Nonomuraea sp. WAC 01424]
MIKKFPRIAALTCAAFLAIAPVTATAATATPARGALMKAERVSRMTGSEVNAFLGKAGFPAIENAKGVDVYRVSYRTVDVNGGPTTATGSLVLPQTSAHELRVVSYSHGTMADRREAPSVASTGEGRYLPVYFATHGFAAAAADYLGLGEGPGAHPYMHTATEAGASIDLLKAARRLAGQQQVTFDKRIMVTGFSQGGHAAMALGAALQKDRDLDVSAIAPISGPFDIEHAEFPAAVDGRLDGRSAAFYLAYWLTSMDRVYDVYDEPSEAFRPPYDAKVTDLLDGSHDLGTIAAALPSTVDELLTPAYLGKLGKPTGRLLKAIRRNDTTCRDLRPGAPVRLFAATGDRDVVLANSESCLKDLRARHVDASLMDVGDVNHLTSLRLSLPKVLAWFQQGAGTTAG